MRRIAFFGFPGITFLDLIGAYDALRRVATLGIDSKVVCRVIGTEKEIADERGLRLIADAVYESLAGYDLLVVPGGVGTRALEEDKRCLDWIRSWGVERPIASVCTGALLLGRAGHLEGIRATTHHDSLERLKPFCKEVVRERIVDEGRVVTAGGVSSSLDLGLHLVGRFWGPEARQKVSERMEYPPPV